MAAYFSHRLCKCMMFYNIHTPEIKLNSSNLRLSLKQYQFTDFFGRRMLILTLLSCLKDKISHFASSKKILSKANWNIGYLGCNTKGLENIIFSEPPLPFFWRKKKRISRLRMQYLLTKNCVISGALGTWGRLRTMQQLPSVIQCGKTKTSLPALWSNFLCGLLDQNREQWA